MCVRLVDGLLATITPTTTNTTTQRHNFVVVVGLIYFVITVIGGILMKSIMNFFIFKLVILLCMITDSYYVMAASRLRFERFPLRSKNDKDDPNKGFSAFPLKTEDENKRNTLSTKLNFKKFPLRTEELPLTPKFNTKRLPLTEGREIFRFNHTANQNCETFRFHQKIEHPGCKPRYIVNHGCFGYCNSFMHIVGNGEGKGQDLKFVQICDNDHTKYRPVKLICPGRKKGYKLKSVLIVKTCKCRRSIPIRRRSIDPNNKDQQQSTTTTLEPGLSND